FESSGGQTDRVAHLPELRFALGEPEMDTTSIDNAVFALEDRAYFIRRVGSDGFRIDFRPTLKKVVSDRRASLDEEAEIKPEMRRLVEAEFRRGSSLPIVFFPQDGADVPDSPRLTLVVMDPEEQWNGDDALRARIRIWTRQRGTSPRLYPGALVWCVKKPGRDLREKVELCLAWRRVQREVAEGILGGDFDRAERAEIDSKLRAAEEAARDEVWGAYRFAVIADDRAEGGLRVLDLGAGHSSSGQTLGGRVIAALKAEGYLSESVGAGYLERNWPPALKPGGVWPLASLRQSFLNGSLTRLVDPDATLRERIVEFVRRGEFGLASGQRPDGTYERVWFEEPVLADEVAFEPNVFLLSKEKARALKSKGVEPAAAPAPEPVPPPASLAERAASRGEARPVSAGSGPEPQVRTLRIVGTVPSELWNRLGTRLLPPLRALHSDLKVRVELCLDVPAPDAASLETELQQMLADLKLEQSVKIQWESPRTAADQPDQAGQGFGG
ncbi:MAG: hypothetical protein WHT82_14075, partial [Limisphaera sp.]